MDGKQFIIWKKIIAAVFFLFLTGFSFAAICLPDISVSKTERRMLAKKPEFSMENIMNGSYMEKLETYFLEQFAGRELFRSIKAEAETKIFGKADSNDYYRIADGIYKLDPDLSEKNIIRAAKAFSRIRKNSFPEAEAYYAVIPDKNYFVAKQHGYPAYDYEVLNKLMQENMQHISYIDIYPLLGIADYYQTDLHWRQECVVDVAEELLTGMNCPAAKLMEEVAIEPAGEFYGGYAGASAFITEPEMLKYLTNSRIEKADVYDYETKTEASVYQTDKLQGTDAYDFYLGGARAMLTLKAQENNNGKKLLIFRDSFGSSIAPLLLEAYDEITLVDLRYVSEDYFTKILNTAEYDTVLFLYSTTVLNHSDSMKIRME